MIHLWTIQLSLIGSPLCTPYRKYMLNTFLLFQNIWQKYWPINIQNPQIYDLLFPSENRNNTFSTTCKADLYLSQSSVILEYNLLLQKTFYTIHHVFLTVRFSFSSMNPLFLCRVKRVFWSIYMPAFFGQKVHPGKVTRKSSSQQFLIKTPLLHINKEISVAIHALLFLLFALLNKSYLCRDWLSWLVVAFLLE